MQKQTLKYPKCVCVSADYKMLCRQDLQMPKLILSFSKLYIYLNTGWS